jgi:uncharacterized protein DUF1629
MGSELRRWAPHRSLPPCGGGNRGARTFATHAMCLLDFQSGGSAVGADPLLHIAALRMERTNMTEQPAGRTAKQIKPKARKFYIISYSYSHKLADFEVENLKVLRGDALALYPPEGRQGFPIYPEKPHVVIGKRKKGPPPSDIELFHSYWLISDRLKSVFELVDPAAFAFQSCDVTLRDGSQGPIHWLCDVIRVLEAFGEPTLQDIQRYRQSTGLRYRGSWERSSSSTKASLEIRIFFERPILEAMCFAIKP